jgi:hypothetical protein
MVSATQKTDASRTVTQNYRQRRHEGPIWWHKDIYAVSTVQAVIGREDYLLSPERELVYAHAARIPPKESSSCLAVLTCSSPKLRVVEHQKFPLRSGRTRPVPRRVHATNSVRNNVA